MYETDFEHHGIKGQRWGVRRYQNEDGTLTEEGKKKYGSEDAYRAQQLKKMDPSRMSNAELKELSDRMALEKSVKKGDEEVNRIMAQNGMELLKTAAVVAAVGFGAKYAVDHLPEIVGTVAKSTARATTNAASEVTKAATDAAANAVKSVGSAAANVGHEARKSIATSEGARKYVQTMDKLTGGLLRGGRTQQQRRRRPTSK